ncbi:MAG TPA: glycosyltransferase family 1 protein, partial [Adhaeribacter sp.]|nr:glycosyltransferase family 1 protein [Adhaeribacter sp.]
DLAFEHYPKDLGFLVRQYLQYFTPRFARASERIIAVSEYTRQDIVATYHIPAAKIDVVYNDASGFFQPASQAEADQTRHTFSQDQPYFMFVGAQHPRKNLVNLLKAFDEFKTVGERPEKLLIVGRKAWKSKAISETYANMLHRNDVIFTGRVSDEELSALYGAALATVYVPTFEGFGIPIVEAQKCGCPVITSNVSSMPEVAGDSALLVDPFCIPEIASAMKKLADDPALRKTLVYLGRTNLKRFSWDLSAEKLWQSLEKAAATKP